jgi:hypothetical protein
MEGELVSLVPVLDDCRVLGRESRASLLAEDDLLAPGLRESDLDPDGRRDVATLVELPDFEEAVRLVE